MQYLKNNWWYIQTSLFRFEIGILVYTTLSDMLNLGVIVIGFYCVSNLIGNSLWASLLLDLQIRAQNYNASLKLRNN